MGYNDYLLIQQPNNLLVDLSRLFSSFISMLCGAIYLFFCRPAMSNLKSISFFFECNHLILNHLEKYSLAHPY